MTIAIQTNNCDMKLRHLLYLCFIIAFTSVTALPANAQNAIRWRTTVKMTSEKEGILTVRALVGEGWHLYGTSLPKGGPKATVLDFSGSKGIKFKGDFVPSVKPVSKLDPMFGITLSWWNTNVTFTRRFKLTDKKADAVINGKITYMGCNDETCLPPKSESFVLKIK